jgi:hypothetical protein
MRHYYPSDPASLGSDTGGGSAAPSFQKGFDSAPLSGPGQVSDQSSASSGGEIAVAPAAVAPPAEGVGPMLLSGPSTPTNIESTNWSGGVITAGSGDSFSTVSAQWVVPTIAQVPGVTTSDIAEWVGIDGYQSSDVCQAGVYEEAQTANGQTTLSCQAWVEWYPADADFIAPSSFQVDPGNTIKVTVETSGAGATTATIILDNETTGQIYDTSLTAPNGTSLQGNSAEAIVETPELISGNGQESQPPLADFLNSPVTFDDVSATYSNGSAASLSSAQSIGMWTDNNDPPGVSGSVQEAYGSIQPASDSVTVTENDYWGGNNAAPPSGTTATMITVDASGDYEIYDLGNNTILESYPLTQIASPAQVVGLGNFSGSDSTDMVVRNGTAFQYYDVANNNVTQTGVMGAVGTEWSVVGTGKFDNSGFTDMMMFDSSDGAYDVFDVRNNQITGANQIADVGNNWQLAGFGDFNGGGTTDMLLQNPSTGAFEYYDIANGQVTAEGVLGNVGNNWQVVGFGNFDNSGFTDMMMYDSADGAYDIFDIRDNQIVGAQQIAAVGTNWQVAGFADLTGDGTMDMVLNNPSTGAFEYYDIANGQLAAEGELGQVGTQWTVVGLAPYSTSTTATPATTTAASDVSAANGIAAGSAGPIIANGSPSQQPMGLGGGASEVVPPMSSLFSAPATMAQFSPMGSEFGTATPLLAVNPLQHAV